MQLVEQLKKQFTQSWNALFRGSRLPTYLGILATSFVLWIQVTDEPFVKALLARLEYVVYDLRFGVARPAIRPNNVSIVIVDYDQRSLETEGQWPWSRFKIGNMVRKLGEDGAQVIGFDVFFPEYERNLVKELGQRIDEGMDTGGQAKAMLPKLKEIPGEIFDGDAYFAESMQGGAEVVLGFSFRREDVHNGKLPQPLFEIPAQDSDVITVAEQTGYIGNNDTLQKGAAGAGFFDTIPDEDGVIRSTPLVFKYENHVYPSLALDMARRFNLEDRFEAKIEADSNNANRALVGISMRGTFIPTDPGGAVKVPYLGKHGSYPYISATDVLHDTLTTQQREQLKNSLVLIGTTATGLYDLRATPLESVYPGVEIHANVLNAILSSQAQMVIDSTSNKEVAASSKLFAALDKTRLSPFPSRPDWEWMAVATAIVIIGIGLSLVYPHLGPALLGLSSLTFVTGLVVLNFYLWSQYNLDVSLVVFVLLVLLLAVINMAYGFLKEGMNRKMIKGMFDQYVPPAHIDAMLNNPDKYNFSGESKELSVLFSDIRSFTTISEKLKATELKAMLNEFFTPITGIIFDHNGTIDKYVGDMVMAFWGAPLDDPRHREHAVTAALNMLKKVEELKPIFRAKGLPEVNIGIGVNSGMMNVGDMGSTYRRAYTVIGDAVNLGSRLEGITKNYGVKLLIGEQTYDGLSGFLCRQIDKVMVKGKDEPIRIYQPLCRDSEATPELRALVEEFHAASHLYQAQQWDQAAAAFEALKRKEPDSHLYDVYLERIANLRTEQLPPDWDGAYRFTTK